MGVKGLEAIQICRATWGANALLNGVFVDSPVARGVSVFPGVSATGPFYQASAPARSNHVLISNDSSAYSIYLKSYSIDTTQTAFANRWIGTFAFSGPTTSPSTITTYVTNPTHVPEQIELDYLLPPGTNLLHYNVFAPPVSGMSATPHTIHIQYDFVQVASTQVTGNAFALITSPPTRPAQVPEVIEVPAGDVTPDALYWPDMTYYMMAGETDSYEDQITGIDTTITLRPEYSQVDGLQLYYRVDNTQQSLGTLYDPASQGFTLINSGGTFTVTNGKWLTFTAYGNIAGFLAAVSLYNQSDGDAVVAEFNISTAL